MLGFYGSVNFNDIKLHLIQNIEHVVLKIGVCFVDFIDQKHNSIIRRKCLTDFAHFYVILDVADISLGVSETAVIQPRQGIVLVQCIDQFHA